MAYDKNVHCHEMSSRCGPCRNRPSRRRMFIDECYCLHEHIASAILVLSIRHALIQKQRTSILLAITTQIYCAI